MAAETITQVAASVVPAVTPPMPGTSTPQPITTTAIITEPGTNTRTTRTIPVFLPAATLLNGQVQPTQITLPAAGSQFRVLASSANVAITPYRGGSTGAQNSFGIGQGCKVANGFENLIVANYNTFPVVASLWVGFDDFINDQLILAVSAYQPVAYPTNPVLNATANINIQDLSGQTFTDINGQIWGAIQRLAILIFNQDAGNTYLLRKYGATGSPGSGPAIAAIPPSPLPLQLQFTGNYTINNGGENLNIIVSEIYYAIPGFT